MENMELFEQPTFTDFEKATAEQVAVAKGRKTPSAEDYAYAVKKCRQWRKKRLAMGLPEWC